MLHQLSWSQNQTPKIASNMQRIAYSSSFIPRKNQRKFLTAGVVFTVNTYECFMENKNLIRILNLIKILPVFMKKRGGSGWTQDTQNIKNKTANKFWQNLSDQHKVKFKN